MFTIDVGRCGEYNSVKPNYPKPYSGATRKQLSSSEYNNVYLKVNDKGGRVPKQIDSNMNQYEKTYKQLVHILQDTDYYMNDGYREFVNSMMGAIGGGRKITTKMDSAISNVIRNYVKWRSKDTKETRLEKTQKIERIQAKIKIVHDTLFKCDYSTSYMVRSQEFLSSVNLGVVKYGGLTAKQGQALNQMHERFKKKLLSQGVGDLEEFNQPIKESL